MAVQVADTVVEASLKSVGKRPDGFGIVYSPDSMLMVFAPITPFYFRGRLVSELGVVFANDPGSLSQEQRARRHKIGNALRLISDPYEEAAIFAAEQSQVTPRLGSYDLQQLVDKGQVYRLGVLAEEEGGRYRMRVRSIDGVEI